MEWTTIKNCGKMGIEFSNFDTEGARISRDFLRQLLNNIVSRCTKYYEQTGDHAFYYGEWQFQSMVCPSIADITYSYLMEHPLKRKPAGESETFGFADYWVSYRDYALLIEIKHSYFAYRNATHPRKSLTEKYDSALNQLANIRKEQCRELAVGTKDLIKIAVEAIVFYKSSIDKIRRNEIIKHNFAESFNQLVDNGKFTYTPNFRALWILSGRMVKPYEYDNGSSEIYPAVGFVGNISEGQTK